MFGVPVADLKVSEPPDEYDERDGPFPKKKPRFPLATDSHGRAGLHGSHEQLEQKAAKETQNSLTTQRILQTPRCG